MSEPTRILQDGGDDFERALLASARADKGSGPALRRVLAALSAAAIVGTGSVGAAASSSAAVTAISIAKWAGVGAMIGGVGLSATSAAIHYSRPAQTSVASAPVRSRPVVIATAPTLPAREPPLVAAPDPVLPAAEPAPATPRAAASPSTDGESKLAEELSLLHEARAALVAKQPEAALLVLQRYERSFSRAALAPEAALLRLEALTDSGQVDAARRLSERLLRSAPTGPYADRVRALSSGSR